MFMKRIHLFAVISIMLLLSFTGCEKENTKGPKIETLSAEKGSLCVVSLSGCVKGLESVALDFECGIEYSTDASFVEGKTSRLIAGKKYSEDPYSVILTNIISGQKYYYRAYYINQLMSYYGEVNDFNFTWDAPQVTTLSAEVKETGDCILTGLIKDLDKISNYNNYSEIIEVGFEYATSENFDSNSSKTVYVDIDNINGGTIICNIFDLDYNTQYYYRAFFKFGSISAEGKTKSFRYFFTLKDNGSENGYQYIELGLSVKWATCNVGAIKPEDHGDSYEWGDTEPKTTSFWEEWSNYKWCKGSGTTLTKYNSSSDCGSVDYKSYIDPEDDVAHVKWGGNWRMPTMGEIDELLTNCSWTRFDGGYKVTSKKSGYTDRSIFLPYGRYWSRNLRFSAPGSAYCLDSGYISYIQRYYGCLVRPVCQ